jgi:magnesium transporter
VPSQGSSWFPLPRRIPARRGTAGNGATTVHAPHQPPLSEEEIRSAVVDCGLYEGGERLGGRIELESALRKADACQHGFVWIGLHDPSPGVVEAVGAHFELHPLAVEDAVHAHQRAKLEVHGGDTLFVVLKTARYVDSEELIEIGEVMVFLGERFVVTVRHGEGSPLHDVRLDLEAHPDLLGIGPSSVLYAIADRVVDDYLAVIDGIAVDVEEVEAEVFSGVSSNPAERIYRLKREVLEFRRAVTPLIAPMQRLSSKQAGLPLDPRTEEYFRDVHDHLLRDAERIAGFDELLTNALQANVAQITMRDNQDVRRISAWVAIIAVPTMVFGVYGMNFEHMPELKWTYGYPLVVAVVLLICAVLYRKFKQTGWL